MKPENYSHIHRLNLLQEFDAAPDSTWFSQNIVAAVRMCSEATLERDRWSGGGIPFVKCGRSVRYRKKDILVWLEQHQIFNSTTEVQQKEFAHGKKSK